MKLREIHSVIVAKEINLSIAGELKFKTFKPTYENRTSAIEQACIDYGEREVDCIYPAELGCMCISVK